MLKVYYSNRAEYLVDLLNRLADLCDPFEPTPIIVPNWNVESYLKFELTRRNGVATGLRLQRFERFINCALPDERDVELLNSRHLQQLVLEEITNSLGEPAFAPVSDYLDVPAPDNRHKRLFQLSAQVAFLFEKYIRERPEFAREWPDERLYGESTFSTSEAWQSHLWGQIFGDNAIPSVDIEERALIPPPWSAELLDPDDLELADEVFIVGFSHLSRMHKRLIEQLSNVIDLHLLSINPCKEYWGDISPAMTKEQKETQLSSKPVTGGQLNLLSADNFWNDQSPPPALQFWGLPGRDHIQGLNELCDYNSVDAFTALPAEAPTTLQQLHRDILAFEGPEETSQRPPDDSITFIEAPSIRRELEVVSEKIWSLVDENDIFFNDIAVIINRANLAQYQAQLKAVFRESNELPFSLVDLSDARTHQLLDGLLSLLRLPLSNCTRADLLEIATHPRFKPGFESADRDQLVEWADKLNILRGLDSDALRDSYFETDVCSWEQGIQKSAISAAFGQIGHRELFEGSEGQTFAPVNISRQKHRDLFAFIGLTRSLIDDIRFCRNNTFTLRKWIDFTLDLIDNYTKASSDILVDVRETLTTLRDDTLLNNELPYRIASEFIQQQLSQIELRSGQYLTDGVAVSSFEPMRPIPFEVIFVVGMGEGNFPTAENRSVLDLRRADQQQGDVFAPDKDEYMFLETLLSARQKLVISHVGKDPHSGEIIPPASTVQELQYILKKQYWGREGLDERTEVYPLNRYDTELTDTSEESKRIYHPAARMESEILKIKDITSCRTESASLEKIVAQLSERLPERLSKRVRAEILPNAGFEKVTTPLDGPETLQLTTSSIIRFLKSPLQGWASGVLQMRPERERDRFSLEDEPFDVTPLIATQLLRSVFYDCATDQAPKDIEPASLETSYRTRARHLELSGKLPTAKLRRDESEKHLRWLKNWCDAVRQLTPTDRTLRLVEFGSSLTAEGMKTHNYPGMTISPESETTSPPDAEIPDNVELQGSTQLLTDQSSLRLVTRSRVKKADFLYGFIDYLMLKANSNSIPGTAFTVHVIPTKAGKAESRTFGDVSQRMARDYISTLVTELVSKTHDYLLPSELAFKYHSEGRDFSPNQYLRSRLNNPYTSISSDYGPVRNPAEHELPNNWRELIQNRFELFFNLQSDE